MYINPFVAGVVCTILVELLAALIYGFSKGGRDE